VPTPCTRAHTLSARRGDGGGGWHTHLQVHDVEHWLVKRLGVFRHLLLPGVASASRQRHPVARRAAQRGRSGGGRHALLVVDEQVVWCSGSKCVVRQLAVAFAVHSAPGRGSSGQQAADTVRVLGVGYPCALDWLRRCGRGSREPSPTGIGAAHADAVLPPPSIRACSLLCRAFLVRTRTHGYLLSRHSDRPAVQWQRPRAQHERASRAVRRRSPAARTAPTRTRAVLLSTLWPWACRRAHWFPFSTRMVRGAGWQAGSNAPRGTQTCRSATSPSSTTSRCGALQRGSVLTALPAGAGWLHAARADRVGGPRGRGHRCARQCPARAHRAAQAGSCAQVPLRCVFCDHGKRRPSPTCAWCTPAATSQCPAVRTPACVHAQPSRPVRADYTMIREPLNRGAAPQDLMHLCILRAADARELAIVDIGIRAARPAPPRPAPPRPARRPG
jgi:hypothetical protein